MGRRKTIDRDHVLEVAERIIARDGAAALTIDAVAKAAGITKGGVQSCFGTKEAMIAAMLRRWIDGYEQRIAQLVPDGASPRERVAAHVEATRSDEEASQAKSASLLAVLLQKPEHLEETRRWYEDWVRGLEAPDQHTRNARLAFLATEGAFLLRYFGLLPMNQVQWNDIFSDIRALTEDH